MRQDRGVSHPGLGKTPLAPPLADQAPHISFFAIAFYERSALTDTCLNG
jgi:hypothetical protein